MIAILPPKAAAMVANFPERIVLGTVHAGVNSMCFRAARAMPEVAFIFSIRGVSLDRSIAKIGCDNRKSGKKFIIFFCALFSSVP
jgi:hypothetical protein